ncbi:DUF4136 domain-containing protein [Phnomibacter ginsenosidimutans]|uniref:DUF4136 domain-containing protein n=1 Tax=Phnomibacter ginsenosidimutans TaxID=2676868 RepID=A0A6I6H1Q8_9BACT|nr:DUF4136 domain-containing protein [Phnomibacter ginsenosidimutans]QGW28561.1 DUF4136 domain-containing protein [Phnomibacter ginsenosidimutans]
MLQKLSWAAFLLIILSACSNSNVLYSSEKLLPTGYDQYKTFAFLPTTDTQYAKMLNNNRFLPLLAAEGRTALEKKGLVLDTLHPDCLFTYHLVINRTYQGNQQQEVVYNPQVYNAASIPLYNQSGSAVSGGTYMRAGTAPGSGIYYFSSDNRPYAFNGKMTVDTLREGSMVIDMIDTKTKAIIWRSVMQGKAIESQTMPIDASIRYYIPKMLKNLPRK